MPEKYDAIKIQKACDGIQRLAGKENFTEEKSTEQKFGFGSVLSFYPLL